MTDDNSTPNDALRELVDEWRDKYSGIYHNQAHMQAISCARQLERVIEEND